MIEWSIVEAILEIASAPVLFYSWLWLEWQLQKNLQQGLAVSNEA